MLELASSASCVGSKTISLRLRKVSSQRIPSLRHSKNPHPILQCSAESRKSSEPRSSAAVSFAVGLAASASVLLTCGSAVAVSGGGGLGNDFDFKDLTGENFEGAQFYKVNFRQTNFTNANLKRVNMFGSFAKGAIFKGADMTGADIESVDFQQADLSDAILTEAEVAGAQFRQLASIDGSDWTDVNLRKDQRKYLCTLASGTNPVTGNDTKETLLCP